MAGIVINIDQNGNIEDGGTTSGEKTRLKRRDTVAWNPRGGREWLIVFFDGPPPLLDTGSQITVDRRVGPFALRLDARGRHPYSLSPLRDGNEVGERRTGPELIIEGGTDGLIIRRSRRAGTKGAAASRSGAARGGKKKAPRKGTRKSAPRKSAKTAGRKATRRTTAKKAAKKR